MGSVVTFNTFGHVVLGTLVPLTTTVIINVLLGPGLKQISKKEDSTQNIGKLIYRMRSIVTVLFVVFGNNLLISIVVKFVYVLLPSGITIVIVVEAK